LYYYIFALRYYIKVLGHLSIRVLY